MVYSNNLTWYILTYLFKGYQRKMQQDGEKFLVIACLTFVFMLMKMEVSLNFENKTIYRIMKTMFDLFRRH